MIILNDDSIYVGNIKQLLHTFNLPMCPIYNERSTYAIGEHYLKGNRLFVIDENGNEKFIKFYKFGDFIEGLTTKFPLSSNIYDSKTHNYLGKYLRFVKDYLGLDLMSLYNCCGYDSPRDLNAYYDKVKFSTEDARYTLIMLPVRWGKEYTIAIDYHGEIEMACMHYSNNVSLENATQEGVPMIQGTYKRVVGTRFNHPFLYDKLKSREHNGDTKEETLTLFIKIPSTCTSSIVVLEGDYRKCTNENMYMDNNSDGTVNQYKQKLGDELCFYELGSFEKPIWNFDYITKNQLLSLNLKAKALLADRLVEYLSKQAIAPDCDVTPNIKRLQKTLKEKYPNSYIIKEYGVWDDSMKKYIYKYLWDSGIIDNYQDMLSYFDKDVETKMGGLVSQYSDLNPSKKTFSNTTSGGK